MVRTAPLYRPEYKKGHGICMEIDYCTHVIVLEDERLDNPAKYYFKFIKEAKGIKVIFDTLIITIPAITNIGGLLLLILFMFSVLGVFLFAEVKL